MEDHDLLQYIEATFRAPDSDQSKEAELKLKEVCKPKIHFRKLRGS
jgi:hypothetical protein